MMKCYGRLGAPTQQSAADAAGAAPRDASGSWTQSEPVPVGRKHTWRLLSLTRGDYLRGKMPISRPLHAARGTMITIIASQRPHPCTPCIECEAQPAVANSREYVAPRALLAGCVPADTRRKHGPENLTIRCGTSLAAAERQGRAWHCDAVCVRSPLPCCLCSLEFRVARQAHTVRPARPSAPVSS